MTTDIADVPARLRHGIVGTGFMGQVHARAIAAGGGELTGVASGTLEQAREGARALGAGQAFADWSGLVSSDQVDVVHVCAPNAVHAEITLAALAAGKHVVCEKPLAVSVEQAVKVTDAAADSGRVAVVPFVYRFHPMVREARARVAAGQVGRLNVVHGSYLQDWLLGADDDNWRVSSATGGPSRAFADIGSHWCDLLEFVTGSRITALSARLATVNGSRGSTSAVDTEDVAVVQFETDAGVLGSTVISQVSAGRKNRLSLEISGSAATLAFDQENPEQLWEGRREGSLLHVRDPQTLSAAAAPYAVLPAGHAQGYQDCFNALVRDTHAAINGENTDGLPRFTDGLRAVRLADAVLASARERSWITVENH
ncbi:Gfo/Idh/MocA family oxidoreductase [Kineosporia sp. J2-2]|uniref:Gfo/Idh/MocA family oxidoreductase n=1 Tax=Kineosporia corallincola TaxID=2835133 RepID=A0ABS5TN04_9ACTN|nr:Gfo/Idh/MocA family oxidoreductase [Kineosporia corallincola]MBT0771448.1 Gfo/Idh/MocA family oxidoreductase [Kineosporia corallincola]